jgi:hypothetical protein
MMRRIVFLLLFAVCSKGQTADVAQDALSSKPVGEEAATETVEVPPVVTCSCEEEIRHLNSILVEKERVCEESKEKSAAHCNDRVQFIRDDAQEAHAALQEEIAKLHSTISQIRDQKDSIHRNCEKSVSDAYAKGWKVAETEYQSQVKAKEGLVNQLRSQHQDETKRLGTVINHIQQQTEDRISECEDRYRELFTSLNNEERKDRQQIYMLEQKLSSAQMFYRAQLEYFLSEKERLEEENQILRQRSSKCLQAFLDFQRQEKKESERVAFHSVILSIWKWTVYTTESCWKAIVELSTYAGESIIDIFIRGPWEKYGQPYVMKRWPMGWAKIQFLSYKFMIHGNLLMGVLVDIFEKLGTEIILTIPELPEILPGFLEDLWVSLVPICENVSQLMGAVTQTIWGFTSPRLVAFSIKVAEVWEEICQVLYRKEMDPYIEYIRNEVNRIHQASTPYIDRTIYVLSKVKKDLFRAVISSHQFVSQTSSECLIHIQRVHRSMLTSKHAFAVKFSGVAKTLLMFLRVYSAPQVILDALEYCEETPVSALDNIGLVLSALLGVSLLFRMYISRSRTADPRRKVRFEAHV